jgi:hypothetical protein
MDIYQGKKQTISPAVGPYDIQVFLDIDQYKTETGIGVTGTGSLTLVDSTIGYTGLNFDNFTNLKHGY